MDQVLNQDKYFLRYKKSGMALIEILLVISILAGMIVAFLKNQKSKQEINNVYEVMDKINIFLQKSLSNALLHKQKVTVNFYFDSNKTINRLNYITENKDSEGMIISNDKIVTAFTINNKDEFKDKTDNVWIYIYPEGYTQEAQVSFIDDFGSILFILNPFLCKFQQEFIKWKNIKDL